MTVLYIVLDTDLITICFFFFFSSRRRHTRLTCDWSSDVCSSDLSALCPIGHPTSATTRKGASCSYGQRALARRDIASSLAAMTAPLIAILLAVQFDTTPRPVMAVGQTVLINVFVNRVDAWAFQQDWARTGTRAWSRNLRMGWEWDEDAFPT